MRNVNSACYRACLDVLTGHDWCLARLPLHGPSASVLAISLGGVPAVVSYLHSRKTVPQSSFYTSCLHHWRYQASSSASISEDKKLEKNVQGSTLDNLQSPTTLSLVDSFLNRAIAISPDSNHLIRSFYSLKWGWNIFPRLRWGVLAGASSSGKYARESEREVSESQQQRCTDRNTLHVAFWACVVNYTSEQQEEKNQSSMHPLIFSISSSSWSNFLCSAWAFIPAGFFLQRFEREGKLFNELHHKTGTSSEHYGTEKMCFRRLCTRPKRNEYVARMNQHSILMPAKWILFTCPMDTSTRAHTVYTTTEREKT